MSMTDMELVDRAAAGDESAFEELVGRYWGLVLWKIIRLHIPPNDRQDVVQEIFLKLWRDLSKVSKVLRSWAVPRLKVIVLMSSVDVVIAYRRRRGNVPPWLPAKRRHQLPGLQVLEHVEDPAALLRRCLSLSERTIVSVPFLWPKGLTKWHIHDPVSLADVERWAGRAPGRTVVIEDRRRERMICEFINAREAS